MSKKALQALVLIFVLFGVLLLSPIISIFNEIGVAFGKPFLALYLYSSWAFIIVIIFVLVETKLFRRNDR